MNTPVKDKGIVLLNDSSRTRDTAFTHEERRHYGLEGLLPHAVESLERQDVDANMIHGWPLLRASYLIY